MTTMTNKEMLEFAARAAGIEIDKSTTNGGGAGNDGFDLLGRVVVDWHNSEYWDPRKDSGNSFDLAAKLGICIEHDSSIQVEYTEEMGGEYELGVHAWVVKDDLIEAKEIYGDDRCDTARLAVLRVAAEIGKRL